MTQDELSQQIATATKSLSQRFAQEEAERPPKKPPEVTSVITSLEPGPIIRDVNTQGGASLTGQAPQPPDSGLTNPETIAGAVSGVAATLVVETDGSGWV